MLGCVRHVRGVPSSPTISLPSPPSLASQHTPPRHLQSHETTPLTHPETTGAAPSHTLLPGAVSPTQNHTYTTTVAFCPNDNWVACTDAHQGVAVDMVSEHVVYPRLSLEDVALLPPSVVPHTMMNPNMLCTCCAF
jgi:hypothetical protein